MAKLFISPDCSLPLDAVTHTFAALAVRGAGKSYTASVVAEEMLKQDQQIVVLDPTGGWWGLRSSADGKSEGYPVVVFGGEHADVPLEETAGKLIANAIVSGRHSAIIDVSLFRKGQAIRFATDFIEEFYRINREPVHLFVDEADMFAPQFRHGVGGEDRLVGAMEDVVRRGRKRGIGCTLITQRPAVLNKNVLTQCETLLAMRMGHPRDLAAIREWVKVHATDNQADGIIGQLPTLPTGTAWLWSPSAFDIVKRIQIRARATFDSSATPKPGKKVRKPKRLAPIDLEKLGEEIRATVERVKADNPAELRRRIAALERELQVANATRPKTKTETKVVETPVLRKREISMIEKFSARLDEVNRVVKMGAELHGAMETCRLVLKDVQQRLKDAVAPGRLGPQDLSAATAPKIPPRALEIVRKNEDRVRGVVKGVVQLDDCQLSGPEQRILDAVAWFESIGVNQPETPAAAFMAGYRPGGGAFNNPKGRLHKSGYLTYLPGGRLELTESGRRLAAKPEVAPTTNELHQRVLARLPGPEQRILKPLLEAYPHGLSNEDLAQKAGYGAGGGAFNNPKGRLRTFGLIDYPQPGFAVAKSLLFL